MTETTMVVENNDSDSDNDDDSNLGLQTRLEAEPALRSPRSSPSRVATQRKSNTIPNMDLMRCESIVSRERGDLHQSRPS
jgi:hypothetical protein